MDAVQGVAAQRAQIYQVDRQASEQRTTLQMRRRWGFCKGLFQAAFSVQAPAIKQAQDVILRLGAAITAAVLRQQARILTGHAHSWIATMYRYLFVFLPLLHACALSAAQNQIAPAAPEFASRYTHLPAEAAGVLARFEECRYFAGEFNGDGSARDQQVNARMDALGCAGMETEIAALRQTYAAHPAVTAALVALIEDNAIEHRP